MTRRLALDVALLCFGILVILVIWALASSHTSAGYPEPVPVVTTSPSLVARVPDVSVPAILTADADRPNATRDALGTRVFEGSSPSGGHLANPILGGNASWVRASLGRFYLAMRLPKGTLVRICGGAGCVVRRVNDYGPSSKIRPPRIADLSAADFPRVCGPLSMGVCRVSAELLPRVELPATDTP